MSNCYWILADGTIVEPHSRHILAVKAAPTTFGETKKSLSIIFAKYGEEKNHNVESNARQEILLRVIKRNHIRIRKYVLKRCQHWSLQLFELSTEREQAIAKWAKYVSGLTGDKYADVTINQLFDNSKMRTSLDKLAGGYDGKGEPEVLSQSELTRIYE